MKEEEGEKRSSKFGKREGGKKLEADAASRKERLKLTDEKNQFTSFSLLLLTPNYLEILFFSNQDKRCNFKLKLWSSG